MGRSVASSLESFFADRASRHPGGDGLTICTVASLRFRKAHRLNQSPGVQTFVGLCRRRLANMILVMSTIDEFDKLLSQMTRAEKAQLLQWVVRDLGDAFPGIESSPLVCGGEPCIVRTRIPVWLLEQARRLGTSEAELLRSYPTLRAEDLANAWAYVRSHREEIERQILENEAA